MCSCHDFDYWFKVYRIKINYIVKANDTSVKMMPKKKCSYVDRNIYLFRIRFGFNRVSCSFHVHLDIRICSMAP